jgi:hypothetical protein
VGIEGICTDSFQVLFLIILLYYLTLYNDFTNNDNHNADILLEIVLSHVVF